MIDEIKTKENELRDLLTASNTRMEEIELQVFEHEERVEKLTSELENVTRGKIIHNFKVPRFYWRKHFTFTEKETNWSQKMATEQQLTSLNDEIENIRSEKKKWRSLAENRETEISTLETAVKKHLQTEMQLRTELDASQKNLKFYEDKNCQKDTSISTLQKALDAVKKEESAIEALQQELNRKNLEIADKSAKIEVVQVKLD